MIIGRRVSVAGAGARVSRKGGVDVDRPRPVALDGFALDERAETGLGGRDNDVESFGLLIHRGHLLMWFLRLWARQAVRNAAVRELP